MLSKQGVRCDKAEQADIEYRVYLYYTQEFELKSMATNLLGNLKGA